MGKSSKKNGKVPKITEEEYARYVSALKEERTDCLKNVSDIINTMKKE